MNFCFVGEPHIHACRMSQQRRVDGLISVHGERLAARLAFVDVAIQAR
jgi:hypothetical protein